jgi:glyoxylase-like metal-dependent hydrolase (beta-lactamase superfamily II)
MGCNVYLVYDGHEWLLIDVGFLDSADEILELIRQLDFPLAHCKTLIATHADVDHIQALARFKQSLKASVTGHKLCAETLARGDRIKTFAEIEAQNIHMEMPPVEVEHLVDEGDTIKVGGLKLEVWHTPGHTDSQLSFRLGDLLFSGDNIYRDGCVGAIDAHHGSDIPAFIRSLERIRASDVAWLLPSHGPVFRKDNALIDRAIARLNDYLHMADFGTCAIDWPLMDQWDRELAEGRMPQ